MCVLYYTGPLGESAFLIYWCRDGELLRGVMVLQYVLLRKREVSVWMALNLLPDGRGLKRELAGWTVPLLDSRVAIPDCD